MDKQEENMSNTNDTIESKQKSEMTKKVRSGKKTGVQKKIIIIGILVSLLVIIYLIGSFYFNKKFLSGTYINDINVSGLTLTEANEKLAEQIDARSLKLIFNDEATETVSGSECGVRYNSNNNVKNILKKQNSFGWIGAYFNKSKNVVNDLAEVDETVLRAKVASLGQLVATPK